jgi:TolA-binding protein
VLLLGVAGLTVLAADKPPAAPPTLDELLNLPPTGKPAMPPAAPGTKAPADPTNIHPQTVEPAKVPEEKSGDAFQLAVLDMKQAAARLTESSDPGLDTQRAQERAIRRLDQLIHELNQRNNNSKQKSQGKRDTGSEKNAQQKQQSKQSGQRQKGNVSDSADAADSADQKQDGKLNEQPLSEKLAEWGNLPPRMRDQLLQGLEDRFSTLYRQMTEKYYKRLAEEQP